METIILFTFTLFYGIFGLRNPPLPNQWLLVLNQDTTADDGYFDYNIGLTGIENKDNPQSNAFSIVGGLDKNDFLYNGAYQFRLVYEGLSDGSSFDKRWTQTSWLMDSTITGSSLGEYDPNDPHGFYGLGLSHGAFLDGNAGQHNAWWYAVGSIEPYEGGIPAVHGVVAKSVRLMVCAGEDCNRVCQYPYQRVCAETFECPLDGNNAVACPMPYNYPSCAPDCMDEKNLNGPSIYRIESTNQCYKTWDDCRNCIDHVDRRDIVDCETGNPIEGFGLKVCSKETDFYADTTASFTIDYQVGMQRYSCDIKWRFKADMAYNVLYTCKSEIPIGECFEEEDDFVQINIKGTNDVCVDAIIFDGKMLPISPIRLGDDMDESPFIVDSSLSVVDMSAPELNWMDAEQYCRDTYGTSLISIHSEDEFKLVREFLRTLDYSDGYHGYYWIGLNDRENEGQYVWSDMSPVDYVNWYPGHPNDANGGEDCADFNQSPWNDVPCNRKRRPLCAKPTTQKVFKRRYNVRDGNVLRRSLPIGYESLELVAPQCLTMRVQVTACEWHDEAVGGDLMMRISGTEGKGNYFSVNEETELPISGETKEYYFTSAVWDGIGKLNGVDLIVEDNDGYCISNVKVDTIDGLQSMDFDANHFGNGIFVQPESLELQHNSRRRMLESEGEETELNSLRIVTIGSLMAAVLCMVVILYYARVTSADKKMKLLDDGNSIQV